MEHHTRWVRRGLLYVTISYLAVGLWATLRPKGFYDGFPGPGDPWIAGDGPYNAHLATDAGIGFLALGAVLLFATVGMNRHVVQAALIAVLVHGIPHLLFHLRHPNEALDGIDALASNGSLALGSLVAVGLLVAVNRSRASLPQPEKRPNERITSR